MFANLYIEKKDIAFTYVFRAFTQYFVEAHLAVITALSLFGYDATSLAHLYLGSFSHSSLQILIAKNLFSLCHYGVLCVDC